MFERYGKRFATEFSIVFFDPNIEYDSELFEENIEGILEKVADDKSSITREIDIGGGADWPVLAIELLDTYLPHVTLMGLFFSGKKINDNLSAWQEIAQKALRKFPSDGFGNRCAAVLQVLANLTEQLDVSSFELLAYQCFDREIDFHRSNDPILDAATAISKSAETHVDSYSSRHTRPIHAFKLSVNNEPVIAIIDGLDVSLFDPAKLLRYNFKPL